MRAAESAGIAGRIITKEILNMKFSKNSLALAAAFAGLVGGTAARAAQPLRSASPELSAGMLADDQGQKKEIEKHACKGLNSCKGQGGGNKKEWGKNSCKGKGACATDGSKPKM
jgi:hypothetical protein